eukprot:GSA25T00011420001.1
MCMDGRTDWLKQASSKLTPRSAFVLDVGGLQSVDSTVVSPTATSASKGDLTAREPLLSDSTTSSFTSKLAFCSGSKKDIGEFTVSKKRRAIYTPKDIGDRIFPPLAANPEDELLRWADSPENTEMMQCKAYMCELCLYVDQFAIDQIIGRIVPIFRGIEAQLAGGRQ